MNGARLLTLLPTLHTRRPLTVIGACAEYCRGVETTGD